MKEDSFKTREQLIEELTLSYARIAALEESEQVQKQVEAGLKKSEQMLGLLIDNIPAYIAHVNAHDLRYNFVNKKYGEFWHLPSEEIIGSHVKDIIGKSNYEYALPNIEKAKSGEKTSYENLFNTLQGRRWLSINLVPNFNERGEVVGIVVLNYDITDRKRTEEALQQSEERFATVFRSSPVAIAIARIKDNQIIDVNKSWEKIMGYAREEVIGRTPIELNSWVDPKEREILIGKLREGGTLQGFEFQIRNKSGNIIDLLLSAELIKIAGDACMLSMAIDITERKTVEGALRQAYAYNRSLIEASLDPLVTIGPDGKITDVNIATEAVTGCTRTELIGTEFSDYFTDPDQARSGYQEVFREGAVRDYPLELRHRDGHVTSVLYNASVYRDDQGQVSGVFAAARDITERKRAEMVLQKREQEIRLITDNIPALISYIDRDGRYRFVNKQYEEWFGIPQKEIVGTPYRKVLGELVYEKIKAHVETVLSGQQISYEDFLYYKHGGARWMSVNYIPDYDNQGIVNGFYAMAFDITERKIIENALQKSEEQYRSLVESTKDSIYLLDRDLRYLFANKAYLERLGLPLQQLIGRSYSELHERRKDTFPEYVNHVFETGEFTEFEYKSFRDNKHFLRTLGPVRGEQGETIAVTVISKDVTHLKEAENTLKNYRNQLRALMGRIQAAREEERAVIAREIHDELGGALTGIKIDLSYLAASLPRMRDKVKRNSYVNKFNTMTNLIDETVHAVRRIITDIRPSILDDFGLIAALEWQAQEFQKRTGIECKYISSLENICLEAKHSTAVFRIFQESLTNVVRHANATKVTVRLYKEADKLILKVTDNGKGMTEEKISDPKSLGLLGMRERALFLGGTVNFSGEPWKGTTVSVEIPLVE